MSRTAPESFISQEAVMCFHSNAPSYDCDGERCSTHTDGAHWDQLSRSHTHGVAQDTRMSGTAAAAVVTVM